MRSVTKLIAVCLIAGAPVSCGSSSSPGKANGGSNGSAGSGGQSNGGSAGSSSNGGSAGSSNGGSAGSNDTGGTAQNGGSAGTSSNGGSAGSTNMDAGPGDNTGGTAATGGTGGMTPSGPAPAANATPTGVKPTSASGNSLVIYSGLTMTSEKLVTGDAKPGYFYDLALNNNAMTKFGFDDVSTASATDAGAALPSTIKYAAHLFDPFAPSDFAIVGINFRADNDGAGTGNTGGAWSWLDATGYTGISFWARVDGSSGYANVILYDATNRPASNPEKGACPAASDSNCAMNWSAMEPLTNGWTQFKIAFATDFQQGAGYSGPLDLSRIGRLDIFFQGPLDTADPMFGIWVTDVELYK